MTVLDQKIPSTVIDRTSRQPVQANGFHYAAHGFRPSKSYRGPTLETIYRDITHHLTYVISSTTIEEFMEARNKAFPKIYGLILASISVHAQSQKSEPSEAIKEELPELALGHLDDDQRKRISFNMATLESSENLIDKITRATIRSDLLEEDRKLAEEFNILMNWAQMNISCLVLLGATKSSQEPANQEIIEELLCGADVAVDVYSIARQALDLRSAPPLQDSPQHEPIIWDEEDEEWANAS